MGNIKNHYSTAFKEEAVKLSYERDNIKELAEQLGVQVQRIYKWRRAARSSTLLAKPSRVKQTEHPEVKRLNKELKNAKLELEILKKAVHIFSKSDGKSINL